MFNDGSENVIDDGGFVRVLHSFILDDGSQRRTDFDEEKEKCM